MRKVLLLILGLLGLSGTVFGIVMTVMAFRFMEYGRVVFYLVITIVCVELVIISAMKIKHKET